MEKRAETFLERRKREFAGKEDGVAESTLVLIPLLALFLVTLEIIIAVNFRNLDITFSQNDASVSAITSVVMPSDEIINLEGPNSANGLQLIVTHRERTLPRLVPEFLISGSSGNHSLKSTGVAVMEGHQ